MNNALKEGYPPFENEKALELAIASVCAKFGKVKSLQIIPTTRNSQAKPEAPHQCLCLLQLDLPKADNDLKLAFKMSTFANDLAFFVDLNEKWKGPRI
jgi:hypothetical protein